MKSERNMRGEADRDFIALVAVMGAVFAMVLIVLMFQNYYEFELKVEALKHGCPTPAPVATKERE